jgi:hypothetical protein
MCAEDDHQHLSNEKKLETGSTEERRNEKAFLLETPEDVLFFLIS